MSDNLAFKVTSPGVSGVQYYLKQLNEKKKKIQSLKEANNDKNGDTHIQGRLLGKKKSLHISE